jgi:hypothetical protein
LRHNVLLWLDEKGKIHRRMLWQKGIWVIKAYLIPNGIANTMSCLSPRSAGKPYLGRPGAIWGRFSMACFGRKGAITVTGQVCGREGNFPGEHLGRVSNLRIISKLVGGQTACMFKMSCYFRVPGGKSSCLQS